MHTFESDDGRWQAIAQAMREPSFYGEATDIRRFETFGSLVFAAGPLVYKLKKPLLLPFLDYGTPARRRAMCEREIDLNQRLAARVYRSVRGVRPTTTGFELCDANDPCAVEHLVEMQVVAKEDMLDWRLHRRLATVDDLKRVGRLVAAFHAEAKPIGHSESQAAVAVATWGQNRLRAISDGPRGVLAPEAVDRVRAVIESCIRTAEGVFEERSRLGWIRDGHGDIRCEHVVLGREVQIIDCVEFDAGLRCVDVASDVAFLVMDLELAQAPELSTALTEEYVRAGGDLGPPGLLWFYAAVRALVRAEVSLVRAVQCETVPERLVAHDHARAFLALAERLGVRASTTLTTQR